MTTSLLQYHFTLILPVQTLKIPNWQPLSFLSLFSKAALSFMQVFLGISTLVLSPFIVCYFSMRCNHGKGGFLSSYRRLSIYRYVASGPQKAWNSIIVTCYPFWKYCNKLITTLLKKLYILPMST